MKSFWIRTVEDRTVLEPREEAEPEPAPGEIVLKVHAAGLNRGELIVGGVMHGGALKRGGTEAAGEIVAVGEGVSGWREGDRVMGRVNPRKYGAFAEMTMIPAYEAIEVPERLTMEEAAAVPVSFLAAYDAVVAYGRLARDEWMLVTAVSSAIGVAALQTAKVLGAHVVGTSGSEAKLEALKATGLEHGIRTRSADFAEEVRRVTGEGADLAVNGVGGSVFGECLRALRFGGRVAIVGYLDRVHEARIDLQVVHANRHVIFGISNSRMSAEGRAATVRGFVRDVLPAFADGTLAPLIDRVFPFDELAAAKDYMESDAQVGKIVVRVAD